MLYSLAIVLTTNQEAHMVSAGVLGYQNINGNIRLTTKHGGIMTLSTISTNDEIPHFGERRHHDGTTTNN